MGTHKPIDKNELRGLKELLCPSVTIPQHMNDIVFGTLKTPEGPLKFQIKNSRDVGPLPALWFKRPYLSTYGDRQVVMVKIR